MVSLANGNGNRSGVSFENSCSCLIKGREITQATEIKSQHGPTYVWALALYCELDSTVVDTEFVDRRRRKSVSVSQLKLPPPRW